MPQLFDPFKIKDVTLRNRIVVAPMCQYSSNDGFPNEWHHIHLGSRAVGGAGMVVVEATAVSPEGRITPQDSGIYTDAHVQPFAKLADCIKQNGSVAGIQIAHAGRKASAARPWEGDGHLDNDAGGWNTIAPSAKAFGGNLPKVPEEMSLEEIERIKGCFVDSAKRSLDAGFELLELHFAHGYLAHEFYSPLSNHRSDAYGGSFENRSRFLLETLAAVREVWPERLPLTARLSVTDWIDGGVTVDESIELTKQMKAAGLDLLDVSHGFVVPDISQIPWGPGFLVPHAAEIRSKAEIPVGVGWMITDPQQAAMAVSNEQTDLVFLARELLRDPYWPYRAAVELGVENAGEVLPVQYARAVS